MTPPIARRAPSSPPPSKADLPDKSVRPDKKRKIEVVLTAAAIAAIIVQASRDQYHAGGSPALVRMTPCEMAERAEGEAPIPDPAVLRRCAIPATSPQSNDRKLSQSDRAAMITMGSKGATYEAVAC